MKRLISLALALVFLAVPRVAAAPGASGRTELPAALQGASYAALGPVTPELTPGDPIDIPVLSYINSGLSSADGIAGGEDALTLENAFVTYAVSVPRDGRYCLALGYTAGKGHQSDIELAVLIDGELPFREAGVCIFRRSWTYAAARRDTDNKGNMLRPASEEVFLSKRAYCEDKEGLYTEPFAFFLSQGEHEITIKTIREAIIIESLALTPPPVYPSYAEVSSSYSERDIAGAAPVTVMATDAHLRSDQSLLPASDRSNPYLEPFSLDRITYNVMGGDMWRRPGQSVSWLLSIPKDGLYSLSFVYKQDAVVGLPVTRSLQIDGETPFAEMRALVFPYAPSWQRLTVQAEGGDALFYLTAGEHELSLAVTLGGTADLCRRVTEAAGALSALYTRIVMITGPNPDPMRDYRIDERLPGIIGDFETIASGLDAVDADVRALGGGRNDALTISIMANQLHDFVAKPDSIPGRIARFKDNIVNLSVWVLTASEMPLALYSLTAAPPGTGFDPVSPGFFASLWFSIRRFFASFTELAEVAGNVYDDADGRVITVWGSYGKDWAEMLKRLCDEVFTPEYGIGVNFSVLNKDETMFFSIAAGTGPDVCLNIQRGFPLDFGLRNAAVDISQLPGYAEFVENFSPTAMDPLSYGGKTYGFPVMQTFPVMYVRTDIFADFGLDIPRTWEELYAIIGALGEKNLQVSPSGDLLPLFYLQNGGQYFSDDLSVCLLDSPTGIAALTEWTNLFTLHGAPVASDFFNRFRTGEMPVGIADITLFTNLHYAALEIKDCWTMVPVPGVLMDDGVTVDRTIVSSAGAGASSSGFITRTRPERLDDCWTFVQWFMSESAQARYAQECEAMFGVTGRYFTANVKAHASIAWPKDAYDAIMASIANLREIPGVPGSYFIGRNVTNAFNEIVLMGEPPRSAMIHYNEIINREMERKRIELGLEAAG